ncbi:lytic transglycosylase domain-containing protein [Microbaculum marinum]|uniref:Transglycosylase SLT domain-containing protein n=1 Tax=Microbaculum marinum TaxID=1764581 RepID=A0AAW9RI41_9HYPH
MKVRIRAAAALPTMKLTLNSAAAALSAGLAVCLTIAAVEPAHAESRGNFDAASSLVAGAAVTAAPEAKSGSTVTLKVEEDRPLGFTGQAATGNIEDPAAPASATTSRFGGDASLPVGRGRTASAPASDSAGDEGASTAASTVSSSKPYANLIAQHARANGVPVALAMAVVRVESNYNPRSRGRAGEVGLMQIKPRTARGMGFGGSTAALYDPNTNLQWGMKYLAGAYKLAGGDTCGTIMRYQGGHYARSMSSAAAAYCSKVKNHMAGKWA